ncbi:U2 small nuclear ribonucleoprotein A', partial [Blyttiomyces sp. JEL0837]
LKIPRIENLAITKDVHDTIDLTDNDIRKLENFPPMKRLKTLLLSNNRISKIDQDLHKNIPNITALILTNNQFSELGDLDSLSGFKNLTHLSLFENQVTVKKFYRLYVIHRCPSVRVLDFKKVKDTERAESKKLFSGSEGSQLANSLSSNKGSMDVSGSDDASTLSAKKGPKPAQGPTPEEAARIREAIANASTLEEVARLKRQLEGGAVPGGSSGGGGGRQQKQAKGGNDSDVEMDED